MLNTMRRDSSRNHFASVDLRIQPRATSAIALVLAFVVWLGAGCRNGDSSPSSGSPRTTATSDPYATPVPVTIESLGLSFTLPPYFQVVEGHPDFLFLARRPFPRAIFSIEPDSPRVIEHEPRPGETVEPTNIDGVDAVIITGAFLERLPSGVAANELLVANGDRSFTAILSAPEPELAALWEVFISSVRVQPQSISV